MSHLAAKLALLFLILVFGQSDVVYAHDPAAVDMTKAVDRFLKTLTAEQKKKVMFEFKDAERENFHFIPDFAIKPVKGRKGLALKDMTPAQVTLAKAIPAMALSHKGYFKAMSITVLEKVLFDLEKRDIRDPELYYVSVFGEPDDHGTWGWRFEGHHLSINVAIIDGERFSVTPSFFGSNPAIVKEGPLKGVEVLADEQKLGLKMVSSLTAEQYKKALIPDAKPYTKGSGKNKIWEMITLEESRVENFKSMKHGLPYEEMTEAQQKILLTLVNVYAKRFRQEVLKGTRYKGEIKEGKGLRFSWMGGKKKGEHHYYAIQSKDFLIEFVNSQNNANHVHSVWREFDGDFGRDFLKEHLEEHHKDEAKSKE